MDIRRGLSTYYQLFGVRGVLSLVGCRCFGVPREIVVKPDDARHPIHLRIRTSDISLYKDILLKGEYDVPLPRPPRTIVDAGANIGMATVYYANKYPEAKIVAVEPEPTNYAGLVKNVSQYPNVIPVNAALWNNDCRVNLSPPTLTALSHEKWAFQVSEGGTSVRGITIRTLMREHGLDSIELLKMDIEGAEVEAFANCDWVDGLQGIVIELHDHVKPGCRATVSEAAAGFHSWERGEMTFYVRNRPRKDLN